MSEGQSSKIQRTCEHCGKIFDIPLAWVKKGEGKFCSRPCHYAAATQSLGFRFLRYLSPPNENGCILWSGTVNSTGYGVLRIRVENQYHFLRAHRIAWEKAHGPIPEGLEVCHRCDIHCPPGDVSYRRCTNPDHLFLATWTENMKDKIAKGRQSQGERCNLSKLTDDIVREIRRCYAAGGITLLALAKQHGITTGNVHAIVHRRTWKHID